MNRFSRSWLALALAALLALLAIGGASAHGGHNSPIQNFTQMVGPYEITVTIEMPPTAPAPLNLDIQVPEDIGIANLTLSATPRGQTAATNNRVELTTTNTTDQPIYYSQLTVDRMGDWDLEVQAKGAQGQGVARIPFTLTATPLPLYSVPLIASLSTLIVLMIAMIGVSSAFGSRRQSIPSWLSWLLGRGMLVALVTSIIFGALQLNYSSQEAQATAMGATFVPAGTVITGGGRPHVNMALRTEPAKPQLGQPVTLTMQLSDGGTGTPVDDIVTHHDALVHLAVLNEDGSFFLHTHPARMAPGEYVIAITPTRPGRYTAYAEIERIDSGTQVMQANFDVTGTVAQAVPAPGFGTRTIDDMQITVDGSRNPVKAGEQTTLTFSFRDAQNQPIRDLRPWLGMAGHLMARSDDGAVFAHVHAAEKVPPYGRPILVNGTAYGPDIRFVYTFPEPGRYHVWGQFKHAGQIVTVPVTIEVAA